MFVKTVPRMLNKYLLGCSLQALKNPHDSIAETITQSLKIAIRNITDINELTKSFSFPMTSEGKRHVLQAYIL